MNPLKKNWLGMIFASVVLAVIFFVVGFRSDNKARAERAQIIEGCAIVIALVYAILQTQELKKAVQVQAWIKLAEDWRRPEVNRGAGYVVRVWDGWKAYAIRPETVDYPNEIGRLINDLARKWVHEHAPEMRDDTAAKELAENGKLNASTEELQHVIDRLAEEWNQRRELSQFLSKLARPLEQGFLTADMVFGVVPEMGRYLCVLIPIEREIQKHFEIKEGRGVDAQWDKPIPKWEFNTLLHSYLEWYPRHQAELVLKPILWESLAARAFLHK